MDLDYHFGTVYVLSRWADFGSFNARTIAASSQLVDDNFDTTPFSDAEEKKNIARGIQVRYSCQNVWGNISGCPDYRGRQKLRNWSAKSTV